MLLSRPAGHPATERAPSAPLDQTPWLDLISPSQDDIDALSHALDLPLPSRGKLDEIEHSSRHYQRGGAQFFSIPLMQYRDGTAKRAPVGLVLLPDRLITIRYLDYASFDALGLEQAGAEGDRLTATPAELLVELLEQIVNRLADHLENLGQTLDTLSQRTFALDSPHNRAGISKAMRNTLQKLGHAATLTSMIRDSLLGLDRTRLYLDDHLSACPGDHAQHRARLATAGRDIASLNDFDTQLYTKIQFLLDATLGFISIEQNDGMKILTVVASIGILPTLIAGIYGMNFKDIPELNWTYGYPYALALMTLSVALPLIWFWRRGWFTRA